MAFTFANLKYLPLLVFQIILMVLYYMFVKYGGEEDHNIRGFEDTHVMIFIGFGFLMTFLKKYSYSALGFNWFLAALVIQWALLCQSFYHMKDNTIYLTKKLLLEADIMSATVLITFGAVLGVASGLQLLFIAIIETAVGCFNFWLVEDVFKAADVGGSIAIHAFGAYFGLGVSLAMKGKKKKSETAENVVDLNGPSYMSDVTAMIGSIFLWIYWPSFNSALTNSNTEYQRAVANTYLALAAATVTTFVMSSVLSHHHGKLDMVHVQNSTLAGGVAVGSVCNMYIGAGTAIAIGMGAGVLSVLGYQYLTPLLTRIGIGDTCGVHNLHGMPGVFSGILTAVFAGLATKEEYGADLTGVFEAMNEEGVARTASDQALNQFLSLIVTLVVSFIAGTITGFLARAPFLEPLKDNEEYNDEVNWELP
ncbi:ammonium transporter Rh type B [Pieris napi]|uniref:ammonium transporter Rh type B n=1 Tax=Pieris napi TaxID=78633 RepID=UPI001FBBC8AD|nr:ammonium transporter Rh type B [Pieris napi]XP_047521217.1 ammonium transporter Rh type B [Pieris napi]XP_047521218.1 ammonium transporter Rh type B [Pieris napi]